MPLPFWHKLRCCTRSCTGSCKTTFHNDKKLADGVRIVTITHPFHPDKGKSYEYIGLSKRRYGKCIRCLDETGKERLFQINLTSEYMPNESIIDVNCVASIDDLLSLKELIDAILNAH